MKFCKYLFLFSLPAVLMVSCKKSDFVAVNINPSILTSVDPGAQFLSASDHVVKDFEYYYDFDRAINPWMQYTTGPTGNGLNFNVPGGNFNYRYDNFYTNVGVPLADIPHLISQMSAAQQAARVYELNVASIYMAYEAFYTSDINGSIPYSQAFKARYGGTLTPVYDPQQTLFDTLDAQIKAAVTALEATPTVTQVIYGGLDPFYGNTVTSSGADWALAWAKTGNALRLKMAMRLMKRDPTKLQAIASDVLKDPNQMAAVADSWVLLTGPTFANATGNFNPTGLLATKPMVDFLQNHGDPRLRMFYRKDSLGLYIGSPTNPDTAALNSYQALYTAGRTFSPIQHRLFAPNFDESDGNGIGQGVAFFPVLTYAEYCFIRADMGARGITADDAATWYTNGVTASIQFYDQRATAAQIVGYKSLGPTEISDYLAKPGITFDPSRATEQIACQANVEFYRQPAEAWAWWKRTGLPNTTSVLAWSPLTGLGQTLILPRRPQFSPKPVSDPNYTNQQAAYSAMQADPNFGSGLTDVTGRIWWDMP
jgi:hypothetical protein